MIGKLQGDRALLMGAVGIFSCALIASGYLLGDGLRRAKSAERSIAVRGVSERDVTANLATWTISFNHQGADLQTVNAQVYRQAATVRRFFIEAGFKPGEVSDSDVSFDRRALTDDDGRIVGDRITVSRSIELRTAEVMKAREAQRKVPELLKAGVELQGNNLLYTFTQLNELKPQMIAEATKRARESAEQFARDSGSQVGTIRTASQGYFSIGPRDGADSEEGSDGSASPYQKVRVVTSIDYDVTG
jgi:hypothetical protein